MRPLVARRSPSSSPLAGAALTAARATPAADPLRGDRAQARACGLLTTRASSPGRTRDVLGMFTSGGAAVAVGDYDNDGFDDLFVTDPAEGKPNQLFRNDGGTDVHRRHRERRASAAATIRCRSSRTPSGSTTTTTAAATCSSSASARRSSTATQGQGDSPT